MTDKNRQQDQLDYIPDRIWSLYFGPEGQIPKIQESIGKLYGKLNEVSGKIDKYNSLHEKVEDYLSQQKDLTERIDKQEEKCKSVLEQRETKKQTEAEVLQRVNKAEQEAKAEEHNKFIRTVKTLGITISIAVVAINVLLFIVGALYL